MLLHVYIHTLHTYSCSVLQCVAVCCSVLQCVAVRCYMYISMHYIHTHRTLVQQPLISMKIFGRYMYIYVYMHIFMYTCTYICIHICINVHICMGDICVYIAVSGDVDVQNFNHRDENLLLIMPRHLYFWKSFCPDTYSA